MAPPALITCAPSGRARRNKQIALAIGLRGLAQIKTFAISFQRSLAAATKHTSPALTEYAQGLAEAITTARNRDRLQDHGSTAHDERYSGGGGAWRWVSMGSENVTLVRDYIAMRLRPDQIEQVPAATQCFAGAGSEGDEIILPVPHRVQLTRCGVIWPARLMLRQRSGDPHHFAGHAVLPSGGREGAVPGLDYPYPQFG